MAGRDGDKPCTTSGVMSSYGTSHWIPDFNYEPSLLAKILKPSETVALCCPRFVCTCLDAWCPFPLFIIWLSFDKLCEKMQ